MPTVSDFMLERLSAWGTRRIYGYPGDGINGIMGALDRAGDTFEFVQVRHEEMAAFMACAHAKFTGELGVCMATSGPGAIHLLNGLYDAKMDHQPVLAIVGQQARMAIGSSYQQEVDLQSLFKDVASYVQVCSVPGQMRQLVDRAARIALAERTVTCIIVPNDVQELDAEPSPPRAHGSVFTSLGWERPRTLPHPVDLERAAAVLNAGEKVALLIGAGAAGASAEVLEVANRLGAGVAKALLGKDAIPDDVPFCTGSIGLLGTRPSWELMKGCDTLLMVGTAFPYGEFLPDEGAAKAVQIDLDPRMLGARYPLEVALAGDSRETLQALLPLLQQHDHGDWRDEIERNVADWRGLMDERAGQTADPVNPQLLFRELSKRLPDGAIVTADSGSAANWYA
ncbi:MAG TPA: thiamine pyrophosphate-binding protein, partial [Gaiellales bacterium]